MDGPPTQIDLARRLGLSRATVSRALAGSPLLPMATCERVRRAAEALGYRPDPLLAALAMRRTHRRSRRGPVWALLYAGGSAAADMACHAPAALARGYGLTPVALPADAAALDRQLDALGACGVLVAPLRDAARVRRFDWPRLAWNRRSWLAIGIARWAAPLHIVRGDAVEGVALALAGMHARGFQRIAVLREHPRLSRINELQGAGLALARLRLPGLRLLDCPLLPGQPMPAALAAFRPQAILTGYAAMHRRLGPPLAGLPWASLGFAAVRGGAIAGVTYDPARRADAAADWLDALIRRGERGLPALPHCLSIAPEWIDGRSLSPAAPRPG